MTNFSRRGFLQAVGVTAATIFLPRVPGGVLVSGLTPQTADAAEVTAAPGTAATSDLKGSATSDIIVVSRAEVAFIAYDLSKTDDAGKAAALAGVHVTVTSRYNGAQVEGTTGSDGTVILNIEKLSEGYDGTTELTDFEFNGSITATKDGYREFRTGRLRIDGASGVAVPTRPLDENPYAQLLSFNGCDAQYLPAVFARTPKNNETHTLAFEAYVPSGLLAAEDGPADASTGRLELWAQAEDSDTLIDSAAVQVEKNLATGTLEGDYLRVSKDNEHLIPADVPLYLKLALGQKTWRFSTTLQAVDGKVDEFESGKGELNICTEEGIDNGASVPKEFPALMGSSKLSAWIPSSMLRFECSPYGTFLISVQSPNLGFVSDKGTRDGSRFGLQTKKELTDKSKKAFSQLKKSIDRYRDKMNSTNPDGSSIVRGQMTSALQITGSLQVAVLGQAPMIADDWALDLQGLAVGQVSVTISQDFIIVVVPVFVAFDFSAAIKVALGLGGRTKNGADPTNGMTWDYEKTGFTINTPVSAGLSAGLGFAGAFSVGVRGCAEISTNTVLGPTEEAGQSHAHFTASAASALEIVAQALLFKWNQKVVGKSWPNFYDNWKGGQKEEDVEVALPGGSPFSLGTTDGQDVFLVEGDLADTNMTEEELLAMGVPVTQDELLGVTSLYEIFDFSAGGPSENKEQVIEVGNMQLTTYVDPRGNEPCAGSFIERYAYQDVVDPVVATFGAQPEFAAGVGTRWTSTLIEENTFSDPRIKVVQVGGASYVFRIAPVDYTVGGQEIVQNRLVVQTVSKQGSTYSLSRRKVIEFDLVADGVRRRDLCDYEFDVCSCVGASSEFSGASDVVFRVLMVCGVRESGVAPDTVGEALSTTRICTLSLDKDFRVKSAALTRPGYDQNGKHAYSCPKIILAKNGGDGLTCFAAFIHRRASSDRVLATSDAEKTLNIGVLLPYEMRLSLSQETQLSRGVVDIELLLGSEKMGTTLWNACSVGCVVHDAPDSKAGPEKLRTDVYTFRRKRGGNGPESLAGMTPAQIAQAFADNPVEAELAQTVANAPWTPVLRAWPGHEGWLIVRDNKLWQATFDEDESQQADFSLKDVGPAEFAFKDFCVSSKGDFLYMAQNTDDMGLGQDAVSQEAHRVMACVFMAESERFTPAFAFAELENDKAIHGLTVLAQDGAGVLFAATEIVDFSKSKASLWMTQIPYIIVVDTIACEPVEPVAFLGRSNAFDVTIKNRGNVAISKLAVHLRTAGNSPIGEATLTPSRESVRQSIWWQPENQEDGQAAAASDAADPVLDPVGAGVLLPGQIGIYRVAIKLPDVWPVDGSDVDAGQARTILATANGIESVTWQLLDEEIELACVEQPAESAPQSSVEIAGEMQVNEELSRGDVALLPDGGDGDGGGDGGSDGGGDGGSDGGDGSGDGGGSGKEDGSEKGDDSGKGDASGGRVENGSGNNATPQARKKVATPETGDDLSVMPLVFGVAGAAILAYERRRAANEIPENDSRD